MRRLLGAISIPVLLVAALPAAASPIYSAGTYSFSGTLDNQSFGGTIVWNGSKVTGYTVNFDGQTFTCSSKGGTCSVFDKTIKITGGTETLAGLFTPGSSPFTLTIKEKHSDPVYGTKVSWSSWVAAPEESSLVQAGCLLALFALAIPWAGRLRYKRA